MQNDKIKQIRYLPMLVYAVDPSTGEDVEIDYIDAIKARINPSASDKVVLRNGVLYLRPENQQ